MRFLMKVSIPVEAGNAVIRSGKIGEVMQSILADAKPEAAYFCEDGGTRTAFIFVNIDSESDLLRLAEPWFLAFNASVEHSIAMTPEDLGGAGPAIEDAVKKYS
jgi:hypothetical protein